MSANQQTLSTSLRQEQQLSARQLQSLELLNLPLLDLEERLTQELAANPLLEAESDEEWQEPAPDPAPDPEPEDEATLDERAAESEEWADELPMPPGTEESGPSGEQREYMLNSLASTPSLQEQLSAELAMTPLPPRIRRLAEEAIGSIDDSGYLRTTAADLAMCSNATLEEAEAAIHAIQQFDPPGVGCRNLAECLRLQLERKGALTPLLSEILDHHLDEIARNRLPQLARTLHIPLEELNAALAELRKLNPFPGSALATGPSEFVLPEVAIVRKEDGDYEAVPRRNGMPKLFLAERYLKLLETPELSPEDRTYLREKLQQARELMRALDLRQSTIMRIAEVIIRTQRDFLDRGVEHLKPLTMKQAGEMLDLHETTVSRAVAGKFVETPQGTFPFKYFFTAGFTGEDGRELSNRAVMEKIRELIDQENPAKPLSDEQLAQQLKAEGLAVARRTVAKYREQLNIPSSSLRRKHL